MIALAFVGVQRDLEARMQELRRLAVVAQQARRGAEAALVDHDVGNPKAPVFPAVGRALALDQHGHPDRRLVHVGLQVVLEIEMVGNLALKSLALAAIFTAIWRATDL